MDMIMALCAEARSSLLSDFLDQEHKTWPDEVVLPRSRLSGRQAGACSFLTPARPCLIRIWGWNSSLSGVEEPPSFYGACSLMWEYLSLLQTQCELLCSA